MTDENKENNQEENQNRQECNKIWWKNVGFYEVSPKKRNQSISKLGAFFLHPTYLCPNFVHNFL